MTELLFFLASLGYLGAAAGYIVFIIRQRDQAEVWAVRIMTVGAAIHTVQLILQALHLGHASAVNLSQSLGFMAWAVAVGFLLVQLRARVKVLGALIAPLALLFMITAWSGSSEPLPSYGYFKSIWLNLHIAAAFLGEGVLAGAAGAGLLYLLLERDIKGKRFGWLYSRAPSLSTLDHLGQTCLIIGFPLFTVGMLSGAIFSHYISGSFWRWDGKEVWSLVSWIVYAVLLHQRLTVGWRGRKAAWLAIIGFGVVLFTFFGATGLMNSYHSFDQYGANR